MEQSIYGDKYQSYIKLEQRGTELIDKIYQSIKDNGDLNPVEHIKHRIKTPESLKEKLKQRNLPITMEAAEKNIHDIVGFRIVCTFVGEVFNIVNEIKKSEDITVIMDKDYINMPKPNGYRSYHMIIAFSEGEQAGIPFEIQLRTIAMDSWASLEHQLKYKHNIKNEAIITTELKRCADEIASTDLSMQSLRNMINVS